MMDTVELEKICEAIVDCPHSTPKWEDKGVIVLRNTYVKNGRLNLNNPSFTNEEHYKLRTKRITPKGGDLIISREAPIGEICMIPNDLR